MSSSVSADDSVVDEINITVPASCSIEGTGMTSHNANIVNGTVNSSIGETTMKAFCNDNEGFAIYAIGYTDNTDGKNVLTNSTLGSTHDIATGTATSGNASNWAMKLSTITSPTPTYPITIQNSFDSFHTVPNDYTLVAKRTSATDVGQNAEGSTLKSTYQAYISQTQPAGTYTGQVKYVLAHPNYVDKNALKDAITVIFEGNDLTFPDGSTTNTVKYAKVCIPEGTGYVGNNYQEVMSPNVSTGGIKNAPYYINEEVESLQPITVDGADKLKVVIQYGLTMDSGGVVVAQGDWDAQSDPDYYYDLFPDENNLSRTDTYYFNGDTITFAMWAWDVPDEGYDFGFYAKVYPIYNSEQPNTVLEDIPSSNCSIIPISGSYMETNPWKGEWRQIDEGTILSSFNNEGELEDYLDYEYESIKGTTITLQAKNPYTLIYNSNGASNEFGMGAHMLSDRDWGLIPLELYQGSEADLLAPNFKRSGYSFIAWSLDANAASHINTATLYGPNQTIAIDQTVIDAANNDHEITLYAIWLPSTGNLQNWSGCSNMQTGDITVLTDTRDNNTYAIAKLADGNCWMVENLRLGSDSPITLTISDTQSAGILPAATNNWGNEYAAQNIDIKNSYNPPSIVLKNDVRNYAFGNYYSWATAINTTEGIYSGTAVTSICPAGWTLPSAVEYADLLSALGSLLDDGAISKSARSYPNNFLISGKNESGFFINKSSSIRAYGNYWTSTASGASPSVAYVFHLTTATTGLNASTSEYGGSLKSDGRTIRCVVGV